MNFQSRLKNLLFLDPVQKVTLASKNIQNSIDYWNGILGLKIYEKSNKSATLGFGDKQAKLVLHGIGKMKKVVKLKQHE